MQTCSLPAVQPVTPPQDHEERPQRDEMAPKALAAEFDGLSLSGGDASPRSPFSSSGDREQRGQPPASSTSDDDCGGCSSSGDLAAAAAAAGAHLQLPRWRQAAHDKEEPILCPNSERFCLLPVK